MNTTAAPSSRFAAVVAVLGSLVLGETSRVSGHLVTRVSLFGYCLAGNVLELGDAAKKLAQLVARVKLSLLDVASALHARGITGGRISVSALVRGDHMEARVMIAGLIGERLTDARAVLRDRLIHDGFAVGGPYGCPDVIDVAA